MIVSICIRMHIHLQAQVHLEATNWCLKRLHMSPAARLRLQLTNINNKIHKHDQVEEVYNVICKLVTQHMWVAARVSSYVICFSFPVLHTKMNFCMLSYAWMCVRLFV